MDTQTILTLSSVFVVICIIGIVVFFVTKSFVLSKTETHPPPSGRFLPLEDTIPYRDTDVHYGKRTFYDSASYDSDLGKMVIVDLPKKGSEQENNATNFWDTSFAPEARCPFKGKYIVECVKDCDCSERDELLQKLRGRKQ